MEIQKITNTSFNDSYYHSVHPSGLNIYVYPKKDYNSTYAIFGTKYGSINTSFKLPGQDTIVKTPDGIAHYLEHKMFESKEGDAFKLYSHTGASANAYTSFDKTCYLFSCTENFEESLKILINSVQNPYFTDENVQKEQGIIGQEITMYDDDANWRVLFNLLGIMYHNHPVKIDIAGTKESISHITKETLYECYNAYYNLNNMAICVAGNVDPEKTINLIEKLLKPTEKVEPVNIFPDEPYEIVKNRIEQKFDISVPMFQLGFKEKCEKKLTSKQIAETDILLDILSSKASPLYNELLEADLINTSSFGYEYFNSYGYSAIIFSGESNNPDKVAEIIRKAVDRLHKEGISEKDFNRAKKSVYGKSLSGLNSADGVANTLIELSFLGEELFSAIESIKNVTIKDIENRLKEQLDITNSALSIVIPK